MKGKRLLSLVLSLAMLLMCMPLSVYAAGGEAVIDTVKYNGTEYKPDDKNIVLKVPNSFSGNIDLASVLSITYVKENYKYYAPQFPNGSTIKLGETKTLRVQYATEKNGSPETTDYKVSLEKSAFVDPTFSGTVSVRLSMDGEDYKLTRKQFESLYKKNDGKDFGGIVINGANAAIAGFKVGSTTLNTASGGKVTAAKLDQLYVVPKGAGTCSFLVSPMDSAGKVIEGCYVSLDIEVIKTSKVPAINAEITQLETLAMRNIKLSSTFSATAGSDLQSVKITALPEYGRLVYNYNSDGSSNGSVSSGTYMELSDFNKISYIPNRDGVTRTVTDNVEYKAKDKAGNEYSGTISIALIYQRMGLNDLTATIKAGEAVRLTTIAEISKAYEEGGDGTLGYVYFTLPDSSAATMRYNYSTKSSGEPVNESTAYYITGSSRKYLKDVWLIPAEDYSGSFYLYYEAYNSKGASPLFGRIKVTISNYSLKDLNYSVYQDEFLSFSDVVDDINSKFRTSDVASGSFDYVRFTLPGTNYGTLYYNYKSDLEKGTKVKASDSYYRTGTGKQLVDVVFLPNPTYTGSFVLKYNAFDEDDNDFSGEININVKESRYDLETLVLATRSGQVLKMPAEEIEEIIADASKGAEYEYLYFSDLPMSRSGELLYKYSSGNKGTAVEESDEDIYYRTGQEKLFSDVSFVPAKDYSGEAEIEYRAFVSKTEYYDGKIIVRISAFDSQLEPIEYECAGNSHIDFVGSNFTTVMKNLSGEAVDYVVFELPDSSKGALYYDYENESKYGYKVKEGDSFDRTGSGDLISDVSFVPKRGYTGEFELPYTAVDYDGTEYDGIIKITVNKAADFEDVPKTAYFYDPVRWAVDEGITEGTSLTRFSPDSDCTRAHVITFLWRAKGCPEPKSAVCPFPDVTESNYYYKAAVWAFENDIYPGTKEGKFAADKVVTRRDFVYLLWMAEDQPNPGSQKNVFDDVKDTDAAYDAIRWAYKTGVTDGTSATHFSPDAKTNRGQIVTFLYRAYH